MPYVKDKLGVNLQQIDESGAFQHRLRETLTVGDASSVAGRDKLAIYLVAGSTITASENCVVETSGTASGSAGGFISQANATVLPGQAFWAITSARRL